MREPDLIAVAALADTPPAAVDAAAGEAQVPMPDLGALDLSGHVREIRGQRVLLAQQVAELFDVDVKVLNQAVSRHAERFPPDFVFRLTEAEALTLITSEPAVPRPTPRNLPHVFTAAGVAMLSAVLKSPRAVAFHIDLLRGVFARAA